MFIFLTSLLHLFLSDIYLIFFVEFRLQSLTFRLTKYSNLIMQFRCPFEVHFETQFLISIICQLLRNFNAIACKLSIQSQDSETSSTATVLALATLQLLYVTGDKILVVLKHNFKLFLSHSELSASIMCPISFG